MPQHLELLTVGRWVVRALRYGYTSPSTTLLLKSDRTGVNGQGGRTRRARAIRRSGAALGHRVRWGPLTACRRAHSWNQVQLAEALHRWQTDNPDDPTETARRIRTLVVQVSCYESNRTRPRARAVRDSAAVLDVDVLDLLRCRHAAHPPGAAGSVGDYPGRGRHRLGDEPQSLRPRGAEAAPTVIVVQSVAVFNDFLNPLYFLPGEENATVQLTLFNFQSQLSTQYNLLFMSILLITIPPLIMFLFFNRQIVAGLTSGAIKG